MIWPMWCLVVRRCGREGGVSKCWRLEVDLPVFYRYRLDALSSCVWTIHIVCCHASTIDSIVRS